MGQPKLLLPWGSWTLIDQVLQAWSNSAVDQIVVVVRADDRELRTACGRWPVHIVQAVAAPADMKESVRIGLRFVEQHWRPGNGDRCFVAPADLPGLTAAVIDRLLETVADSSAITIPVFGQRQGHPILVPWALTRQIFELADDQGVDQLVATNPHFEVHLPAEDYTPDVDTPQEYRSLLPKQQQSSDDD